MNKKNILLINSGLLEETIYKSTSPPLGLLYIAALLEKHDFKVEFLEADLELDIITKTLETIKEFQPFIVGISSLTATFKQTVQLAQAIKKHFPKITLVFGGHHPTYFADRILNEHPSVDIVIRNEGEYSFLEIVQQKELRLIKGINFRRDNIIIETPDCEPISNLDDLPFPARHLLEKYSYPYASDFSKIDPRRFNKNELTQCTAILTSRGCPFCCHYCANTAFGGNKIRFRSAANVIAELDQLINSGFRRFYFVDDHFMANAKRTTEICDFLAEHKLIHKNIEWYCMGRVDSATESLISAMAKAGCTQILFGVESGSQKILDYYKKRSTPEKIAKAVHLANKYHIKTIASLIIGAPDEHFEDIQETSEFLRSIPIDIVEISKLMILPGTPIYESFYWDGKIDVDATWQTMLTATDLPPFHTTTKLRKWSKHITNRVYKNPRFVARKIGKQLASTVRGGFK